MTHTTEIQISKEKGLLLVWSIHAKSQQSSAPVLLADLQYKHPHDAEFLPNGDMVVATWAPGRVGYWKLLKEGDEFYEGGN